MAAPNRRPPNAPTTTSNGTANGGGWTVEGRNGGDFSIRTGDGELVDFHMNYTDPTPGSDAIATARRKVAPTMVNARDKARTEKALLAKAAGPYLVEPEDVPLEWFTTPHPAPWARWVYVTPQIAEVLLDKHNPDNRRIRPGTVDHYEGVIEREEWHLTHQGGASDTRGMVQDGQHRLAAIEKAGGDNPDLKVPMLWCVGMPLSNFKAIDEGLNRSASDLFTRGEHRESYGPTIGSTIRLVTAMQDAMPRRMMRLKATNEKIFTFWENDADALRAAARFGVARYRKTYSVSSALSALHYMLYKANGEGNAFVDAFLEGLTTGHKAGSRMLLEDIDPRRVARQYFENVKDKRKRLTAIEYLSIMIMAWNNVLNNYNPKYVRFTDDTPVPSVLICNPAASATPAMLRGEVGDN